MKRGALITGGAGFIGSHTVDALLEKKVPVTVLDNLSTGRLDNLNLKSPLLRFIEGDVLDYATVTQAVDACDAILHLTALPSVPKSIEDPVRSHAVNTLGFLHILQAIRETQRPIRLVYASSSAIYGEAKNLPCCDAVSVSSVVLSPYALQKVQNEQYAGLYQQLFGIPSLALRYFNVYGPRQDPQSVYSGVISRFLERYKKGQEMTVFGDGSQARDFIHVKDVVRANCLALLGSASGALNIATGVPETLNKLVSYIEEVGAQTADRVYAPVRQGDIHTSYARTQKAEEELGFRYEVSLREGVKQLMQN